MKRFLASICLLLICASAVSVWAGDKASQTINLKQIGYQHVACEINWKGADDYPKRRIEFLDDEHLLIHFVTSEVCNAPPSQVENYFHSAVIDLAGHLAHTYDWQPGDDVIAGPDGKVLVVRFDAVRVVDLNFQSVQTIPWQQQGFPGVPHPRARLFRVLLTPSRHGFAIFDRNHAALFTGPPYKETSSTNYSAIAVGDHGFLTWSGIDPGPPVLHVEGVPWLTPAHPALWSFFVTGDGTVLGLDHKYNLYRIDQRGGEALVVGLSSLAPGMWNSEFRFDQALPDAGRVLFLSLGARIAFTDTSGMWFYFRTAVLDLTTNKLVFRYNGHVGDDVALSPDGHLVAVREEDGLNLYSVP
jgi:hypothetical protein